MAFAVRSAIWNCQRGGWFCRSKRPSRRSPRRHRERARVPVCGAADTGIKRDARRGCVEVPKRECGAGVAATRASAARRRERRITPGAGGGTAGRGDPATGASGARSDRRERRREGYPPGGPRPRSGLGRVARSRNDAPGNSEHISAPTEKATTPTSCRLESPQAAETLGETPRRGRREAEPVAEGGDALGSGRKGRLPRGEGRHADQPARPGGARTGVGAAREGGRRRQRVWIQRRADHRRAKRRRPGPQGAHAPKRYGRDSEVTPMPAEAPAIAG